MKNPVTLKVLVWSRGQLVTLQILTNSSFSLVGETHGSSSQSVSFSLIDVGSGFTAYVVFPLPGFVLHMHMKMGAHERKGPAKKQLKEIKSNVSHTPMGN